MAKKIKTPIDLAIAAIEARHDELFTLALRLYDHFDVLPEEQRVTARTAKEKLAGLNEAVRVLRKLDGE